MNAHDLRQAMQMGHVRRTREATATAMAEAAGWHNPTYPDRVAARLAFRLALGALMDAARDAGADEHELWDSLKYYVTTDDAAPHGDDHVQYMRASDRADYDKRLNSVTQSHTTKS
jgi:hypothetical protein